jgi:hypothetical protein
MNRIPAWLMTLVKALIAGLLIAWLIKRGLLNVSALESALGHWIELLMITAVYYTQLAIISWRWNRLLRAQGVPLLWQDAFSLTMIGSFFNLVTPSAVGGDLMKCYYLHRRVGERKVEAMATIFLDRVLGMLSLLLTAALAALPAVALGGQPVAVKMLCGIAVLGAMGGAAVIAIAVWMGQNTMGTAGSSSTIRFLARSMGALGAYRRAPGTLAWAVAAGVLSNVLACGSFYLAALAIGVREFPVDLMFLVPLGISSTALPLSPAGVGVGQVAFAELFRIASNGSLTFGANAYTVFQAMQLAVNLTGFFWYVLYRQEVREEAPAH